MNEIDLVDLKQKIEKAKQSSAELKGQRTVIMKSLKDDWKCTTIDDANALLAKKQKDRKDLDDQIEKRLEELSAKYTT